MNIEQQHVRNILLVDFISTFFFNIQQNNKNFIIKKRKYKTMNKCVVCWVGFHNNTFFSSDGKNVQGQIKNLKKAIFLT